MTDLQCCSPVISGGKQRDSALCITKPFYMFILFVHLTGDNHRSKISYVSFSTQ